MAERDTEYLTTRELADLLRIKERKVYELAASGEVPCSRATGKLLFPRQGVEAWLAEHSSGPRAGTALRPNVFLGSHDPLLEWALKASGCGLATYLDGSLDGLERFARGEGLATGLHIYDAADDDWNLAAVRECCPHSPAVLVEFAWRRRGLIVTPGREAELDAIPALAGRRLVARQAQAGSQTLLEQLLADANLAASDYTVTEVVRSETEAALSVLAGKADAALGLEGVARQCRLGFVPVVWERFDLLVDRRAWFEPPMQRFLAFCREPTFWEQARELGGYNVEGLGRVQFNGADAGP